MKGSCLCGAVQYEVKTFEENVSHCHCSKCRKFHGAATGTYGVVSMANFTWTAGGDRIAVYRSSEKAERGFCPQCGSSLFFRFLSNPDYIDIALGTLDEEPDQLPKDHIYTASKAKWCVIGDDLPQYLGGRGSDVE
ncbi:GFA family protein [Hahella sp. KA22]|uniref:GFA family protein n=1 Tax=Hahella sp. KA22 TaxID=1628392 RepID=UPI000FDF240D|nr:GFA family protein [Hahella sp. KA22]AZZ93950.1 GFA family protein [Hahella sp. KA22]QAY57324.1 GFA family protein [Hahella sp. KA22]